MGILQRLDPRHWGGRRVLRLLTSLALVALTLVVPLDRMPAPDAATAAITAAAQRPVGAVAAEQPGTEQPDAEQPGTAQPDPDQADTAQADPAGTTGPLDVPGTGSAGPGTDTAPPAGSRPASHGSRAPPAV